MYYIQDALTLHGFSRNGRNLHAHTHILVSPARVERAVGRSSGGPRHGLSLVCKGVFQLSPSIASVDDTRRDAGRFARIRGRTHAVNAEAYPGTKYVNMRPNERKEDRADSFSARIENEIEKRRDGPFTFARGDR